MKKYLLVLLVFLTLSCEKEGELTHVRDNSVINQGAVLKYKGSFTPTSGINASGTVNVYLDNGIYKVEIENATISSGPDLKVYLSKSDTPNQFVNLGNFAGNGTSVYIVPSKTEIVNYSYILIHCQQYDHLYAVAKLNPN